MFLAVFKLRFSLAFTKEFMKLTCLKSDKFEKLSFWQHFCGLQKKWRPPSDSSLKIALKTYIGSPIQLTYIRDSELEKAARTFWPPCTSKIRKIQKKNVYWSENLPQMSLKEPAEPELSFDIWIDGYLCVKALET